MTISSIGKSRVLAGAVLAAVVVFVVPAQLPGQTVAQAQEQARAQTQGQALGQGQGRAQASLGGGGVLAGFVYCDALRTPVAGAIVKLRNLADMREVASSPSDMNGMYRIAGIPEGRYVLGVSAGPADFNLEYALYLKSGEVGKLSIEIGSGGGGGQSAGYGSAKKKGFFNSVAGRILVISAIGVGLYFVLVEPESSPIR